MQRIIYLFFLTVTLAFASRAQTPCTLTVNSFPYHETFESSNGNWTPGGTASDWAWGTPQKPVITGAGEGQKCWITGGLTNSSYNDGENSFLQSPCFDFTTLVHPRIAFKVFWESEKKYDGAALQYSTDGTTWTLLGSTASNSNCQGVNWYNAGSITYLGGSAGWSGNIQPNNGSCQGGSGSGAWLPASHDVSVLAGLQNVRFRFVFGAGTQCNAFDGFAIDDVQIYEAPPNNADFTFTCQGPQTVAFTAQGVCTTSTNWNFGDPASNANTTGSPNPTHVFTSPGTYTVTLQTTFTTGPTYTVQHSVTLLNVSTTIDHAITCNGGSDGVLTAHATGSGAGYMYSWNTNPPQTTATISGVTAGQYIITVDAGNACAAHDTISLTEPTELSASPIITPQKCSAMNGAVNANIGGGTPGYMYLWSTGATGAAITNLAAGNYSVHVTDANNCVLDLTNIVVPHDNGGLSINLGPDKFICPGDEIVLNPGNFNSYLWQDGSTSPTYTVSATGTYFVTVTDVTGCSATDSIHVTADCSDVYFPSAFTPNADGKNELFGAAGNNFSAVSNFTLDVFNRYGELVFHSNDPLKKWDGSYKGKQAGNMTFVWMAQYDFKGLRQLQKGTVMVIR